MRPCIYFHSPSFSPTSTLTLALRLPISDRMCFWSCSSIFFPKLDCFVGFNRYKARSRHIESRAENSSLCIQWSWLNLKREKSMRKAQAKKSFYSSPLSTRSENCTPAQTNDIFWVFFTSKKNIFSTHRLVIPKLDCSIVSSTHKNSILIQTHRVDDCFVSAQILQELLSSLDTHTKANIKNWKTNLSFRQEKLLDIIRRCAHKRKLWSGKSKCANLSKKKKKDVNWNKKILSERLLLSCGTWAHYGSFQRQYPRDEQLHHPRN